MLKTLRRWASSQRFSSILIISLLLGGVFFLYFWHLGSLTPGMSADEVSARRTSSDLYAIKDTPLYAPQRLVQHGLQQLGNDSVFWMRLSSLIFGLFFLYLSYNLLKHWFGKFTGSLSALIFATTPLVILLSRSATPDILLLAPIAILAAYVWLDSDGKKRHFAWLALALSAGIGLYIPGVAWVLIAALVFAGYRRGKLKRLESPAILILGFVLFLLLITPLVMAAVDQPSIVKAIFLVPNEWAGPAESIKSVLWAAWGVLWQTQYHIPLIIDRLPILNIIQITLVVFGLFAMWTRARKQLYLLLSIVLVSIVAAGLNKNLMLLALGLPALAVFVAAGLRYLYAEWRQVFPRNPLPRALAIILMTAVVSVHLLIGVRYALIAWPQTVDTKNTYVIQ